MGALKPLKRPPVQLPARPAEPAPGADPRVWLPIAEVERRLGLCRKTIWRMCDRGELRGRYVGTRRYVSQASVVRWEHEG